MGRLLKCLCSHTRDPKCPKCNRRGRRLLSREAKPWTWGVVSGQGQGLEMPTVRHYVLVPPTTKPRSP